MSKDDIEKVWVNESGRTHREDGPAVICEDGAEAWYLCDIRHRVDGPSYYTIDGFESWAIHGKLHREDGPAIIDPDYGTTWWMNGTAITESVIAWMDECAINPNWKEWTDQEKILFKLKFV